MLGRVGSADQGTFEIGPIAKGNYSLLFESPEIDTKRVQGVSAPTDDLHVDIHVSGLTAQRGT